MPLMSMTIVLILTAGAGIGDMESAWPKLASTGALDEDLALTAPMLAIRAAATAKDLRVMDMGALFK